MPLLTFDSADLGYGTQVVLPALTLSLEAGERVALLGQSGAGKSTLLAEIRRRLGNTAAWCPQGYGLVPLLSVYHNIYMGQLERHTALSNLCNLLKPRRQAWQAIEALADELGLEGLLRRPVAQLSGGQRQRVAIARAFYQQREVFLGDEPLASVDPHQALRLLEHIQTRHASSIIALHQHRLALAHFDRIVGLRDGVHSAAALQMLVLAQGTYFMTDTNVTYDPSAREVAEMTMLAADEARRFGVEPKVALLSHSNFGSTHEPSALKMREALAIINELDPDLEVEGEMHGDAALSEVLRDETFPNSKLKGQANLLVMPNLDAANIAFNLVKQLASGISVGPMLLGMAQPTHVLNATVTVRGTVNMSALAVVDAQMHAAEAAATG